MKYFIPISTFVFLLVIANPASIRAGDPIGEIGPMNPTMFKCVDKDGFELIQPDPFRKPLVKVRIKGEGLIPLERIEEFLSDNPDAQRKICSNDIEIDFGFDTKDAVQFNDYLEDLKRDCNERDGRIVPITDTKIEGRVFEFHPDVNNPGEWFGVPSKSVPVVAKGITFEIVWGSGEEGGFVFDNLGAGPIVLNLRLPPDAHALNPDIVIESTGLEEVWTVFLGFYRGDTPPDDIPFLRTPDGQFLPFGNMSTQEILRRCGFTDMPNVGGVLSKKQPASVTILAIIVLTLLPATGIFKLLRKRSASPKAKKP